MPVAKVREMLCVEPPKGGEVHITSLESPGRTACGRKCNGWRVVPVARPIPRRRVGCDACKAAIFFPCKDTSRRVR